MNRLVMNALAPLEKPIHYVTAVNEDNEYIIINEFNTGAALIADDEEQTSNQIVQLDIFSNGNFLDLVEQTMHLMKQAGFVRTYEAPGEFDEDMKRFRKTIRFAYLNETI